MPAIERGLPIIGHLPEQLREMLGKRLREVAGLALIALAGAGAAALATWNVQDPSLSHATSGTVRNILGFAGAAGADLLIQLFGLGSIALILCVAVWGWRLLTHRLLDREIMRAVMWLLTAAFAAGFASCMPRSGAWPLPTGLGGVVGDAFLRLPAALFGPLGGLLAPRVWRDLRSDNLRLLRFRQRLRIARTRAAAPTRDVPSAARKRSKSPMTMAMRAIAVSSRSRWAGSDIRS